MLIIKKWEGIFLAEGAKSYRFQVAGLSKQWNG